MLNLVRCSWDEILHVNTDLKEKGGTRAHLWQAIEEMNPALSLDQGLWILHRLVRGGRAHV